MRNKQDGSSALKAELATLRRRVQTLETQLHEQERSSQGLKAAIGERTSQPQGSGRALDNQTKGLSKARDAFREGREMPQAIMNAPDDFVVVLNSDGVIIEANKAIAQQFGMNCEALVGCSAWDLFRDEIAERRMTALESACRTGQAVRFEDEREGRYYDHVVYPIVGPEGTAHKAVVITRDMTQQKQEEDSLRKSEERYRTITQHANDAIVVVQDGKTVYRNPVYEEMVGYTVTETAHQSFFDVIAPKDRKRVREYYEKRLKGRNVPERYEVDVITRDGKGIAIEVKASIIEYHGKKASMAVMRDVTERKKAEEALRQSEARLRTAIESLPFDFFVIDESGHYVMQNFICKQRWGDVIGKRPERSSGRST